MLLSEKDLNFIHSQLVILATPQKRESIAEWMSHSFRLPSGTSEPGLYDVKRAPYQKAILEAMSPQSEARQIVLCFGAQMGKTTCELGAMAYYIQSYPRPQGFAFSNDGELKFFVKSKFNPLLTANPNLKACLGFGSKDSGDTLDEKLYPGGFLKFVSANTEANMRSYSVAVMIADEIDTYPSNVGGNGSPITQLKKRTNTFAETAKMVFSSTPGNNYSEILQLMSESTYQKYMVKCPCCHEYLSFEMEHFGWDTNEAGKTVIDAWMACPHCGYLMHNRDKTELLKEENGAMWVATNADAPKENMGFFLPSFYAPEGWLSWKQIAQEHLDALNAKKEEKMLKLIAFYNTVLCRQYHEAGDTPEVKNLMQRGTDSIYKRGVAPNWVTGITTGADVQGNRVEVTVMGWGKRLRHIPIDHYIIVLEATEQITDVGASVWQKYKDEVVNGMWQREDGFILTSMANALDHSYQPRTIDHVYQMIQSEKLFPVHGEQKHNDLVPAFRHRAYKESIPSTWYNVAVNQIKSIIYSGLVKDPSNENVYNACEFPQGYADEFYEQLVSERLELDMKTKKEGWRKIRARNEVLDTFVYNYAMMYKLGLDGLTDEDWDAILYEQRLQLEKQKNNIQTQVFQQRRRRIISNGVV